MSAVRDTLRSADDLIVSVENQKLAGRTGLPLQVENPQQEDEPEVSEAKPELIQDEKPDEQEEKSEVITKPLADEQDAAPDKKPDSKSPEGTTDDYGNELPTSEKMYSETDVQRMIRDRLQRGKFAEQSGQQQSQQLQQAARDFKPDPESSDTWEAQLKDFVKGTVNEIKENEQREIAHKRELDAQATFEAKFTTGMQRYKDFDKMVEGKAVTVPVMLAARGMADPAAFIYSACKNHASDLAEIANNPDPYQQAMLIGKLDEKMRKTRVVSSVSKPLKKITGDASEKPPMKQSIDSMILQHAKGKRRR